MILASGLWALLPSADRDHLDLRASSYGLLLGCVGLGTVPDTSVLPRLRACFGTGPVVSAVMLTYDLARTAAVVILALVAAGAA